MSDIIGRAALLLSFLIPLLTIHASDKSLTPLPSDTERQVLSLNGKWMYNPAPEPNFWRSTLTDGWSAVKLPGTAKPSKRHSGDAGLRRNFFVPERWRGQTVMLRAERIVCPVSIWVNGRLAGERHTGGKPFEHDVTAMLNPGAINEIALSLATSGGDVVPLDGNLSLFAVAPVNIAGLKITTDADADDKQATLNITADIRNGSKLPAEGADLRCTLADPSGAAVASRSFPAGKIAAGNTEELNVTLAVSDPSLWHPEHPYLYTLTCELSHDGKALHAVRRKVGLATTHIEHGIATINNRPVRLKGARIKSTDPKLLKELRHSNVNHIKLAGCAADDDFLRACDSLGMLATADGFTTAADAMHPSLLPSAASVAIDLTDCDIDEYTLWDIRKLYSPVAITLAENIRPDGYTTLALANNSDSSDLHDYRIIWSAGSSEGSINVDCLPGKSTRASFTIPWQGLKADTLEVRVETHDGLLTDSFAFPLRATTKRINSTDRQPTPMTFLEKSDAYIVTDGTVTFSVSKTNGLLSATCDTKNMMRGPQLMLSDSAQAENWVADHVEALPAKDRVTITVTGTYNGADGLYTYRIEPGGNLRVDADFRLTAGADCGDAALRFTTERLFDRQSWNRRSHLSGYPAGHPDADRGTSAPGSRAYESTKRDFREIILTDADSRRLTIVGDGRHEFRIERHRDLSMLTLSGYSPCAGIIRATAFFTIGK